MLLHRSIALGCLVFLSVVNTQVSQAQDPALRTSTHPVRIELNGIVRYADVRRPAANIIVTLEAHNGGVVAQILTDRDGRFRISGLAARQYTVTVHAQGYKDAYQTVEFLTTTTDYVNLDLYPESQAPVKPKRTIAYIDATVPEGARKEFEKGEEALSGRNFAEAIQHFENAVQMHPQFFEAELSLGTAYMDQGQWDNAEASLKQAASLNPKSPNAFFALGEVFLFKDRLSEAEQNLREGLKLAPRSWKARFTLARVYWKKSDLVNTGKQLALTLQLNPDFPDAHYLAGHVLTRAGKFTDASFQFQEYLRLAPKGANAVIAKDMINKLEKRLATSNN